jgi:hypothetical protein
MGNKALRIRKLISSVDYIVVFKNTASQEVIDNRANEVSENGGSVTNRFSSAILKVRSLPVLRDRLGILTSCNQGFSAKITDTYLTTLQSSLQQDGNEILYIGEVNVVWRIADS